MFQCNETLSTEMVAKGVLISAKKMLKEANLTYNSISLALSLIPVLGWNDKKTIATIQAAKKLLDKYMRLGLEAELFQQEEFIRNFYNILQEGGIEQPIEQLILACHRQGARPLNGSKISEARDYRKGITRD